MWWKGDYQFYSGRIDAFDTFSGCHRVCYDDQKWEYVRIGCDIVVISLESDEALANKASEPSKSRRECIRKGTRENA